MNMVGRLNRNSNIFLIVLLSLILILFSTSTLALEDFTAQSKNKEINLCQCSSTIDEIKIKNLGYLGHTYNIYLENNGAEFSKISLPTIYLRQDQEQLVYNSIYAPCNEQGSFQLDTIITDEQGFAKKLSQTININRCTNIQVTPINPNQTISPCKSLVYEFKIKNTGSFLEEFDIEIKPERKIKDFFSINTESFTLLPGSEQSLLIYFKAPCSYFGQTSNKLIIKTKNTKLKAATNFQINVLPKFNFSANIREEYSFCEQQKYIEQIHLKNNEDHPETFELSIKGPNFLDLPIKKLTLGPKTEYNLNFTSYPGKGSKAIYPVILTITQKNGPFKKILYSNITVNECYDYNVIISENLKACNKKQTKIPITITNNANKDEEFELELEGDNITKLEQTTISVSKNSEATVNMLVTPDDNVLTKGIIIAKPKSNPDLKIKKNIIITTLLQDKCYEIIPAENEFLITKNTTFLELKLKNVGVLSATYDLAIVNPEQLFSLNPDKVTINPGEEAIVNLDFAIPENITKNKFEALLLANANNYTYSSKLIIKKQSDLSGFLTLRNLLVLVILIILLVLIILGLIIYFTKEKQKKKPKKKIEKKKIEHKVKKEIKPKKEKDVLGIKLEFNDKHLEKGYKLDLEKKTIFKKYTWLIILVIIILLLTLSFYFAAPYFMVSIPDFFNTTFLQTKQLSEGIAENIIKTFNESITETSNETTAADVTENVTGTVNQTAESSESIKKTILTYGSSYLYYFYYIIIGIVILTIIILIINSVIKHRGEKNNQKTKKEKRIEKKEKVKKKQVKTKIPKKTTKELEEKTNFWRVLIWVLLIGIIIAAIVYFIDYLKEYSYYIGIGIIILIILIIIDKKRNKDNKKYSK